MNYKEQQKEELTQDLMNAPTFYDCDEGVLAEYLLNLGYRKIPPTARVFMPTDNPKLVLIDKEEYEMLKQRSK